jgi:plasmid stabilization system protein ParE
MNIRFLPAARQELDDAVEWYDQQLYGLGIEFLDELDKALHRIVRYPNSCEEIENGLRRCLINRFPYGIIYGLDATTVVVIAVAHLHREPRYWIDQQR